MASSVVEFELEQEFVLPSLAALCAAAGELQTALTNIDLANRNLHRAPGIASAVVTSNHLCNVMWAQTLILIAYFPADRANAQDEALPITPRCGLTRAVSVACLPACLLAVAVPW